MNILFGEQSPNGPITEFYFLYFLISKIKPHGYFKKLTVYGGIGFEQSNTEELQFSVVLILEWGLFTCNFLGLLTVITVRCFYISLTTFGSWFNLTSAKTFWYAASNLTYWLLLSWIEEKLLVRLFLSSEGINSFEKWNSIFALLVKTQTQKVMSNVRVWVIQIIYKCGCLSNCL